MERLNPTITERVPSKEALVAEKVLNLSPELRSWAVHGYQYGYFNDEHLSDEKHLRRERKLFGTSAHENAHKLAVNHYNWNLHVISIVQKGNTLGYVEATPPMGISLKQMLLEKMVICFSGMAGEEAIGEDDHRGCGSDVAQANYFAEILSKFTEEYQGQFYTLINWAKSEARNIVRSAGENHLKNESFDLMRVGIK